MTYSGPLSVPPGSVVTAQAIATSDLYTNSSPASENYQVIPADLLPPIISPNRPLMGLFTDTILTVTLIEQNSTSISRLQYRIGGDPWQDYTGPFTVSRDDFPTGALNFSNIALGDRFEIGSLSYYNGTILSGTGADAVSFGIDLGFLISGLTANASFEFDLELINVANKGNPSDPWADADYVRLANPVASQIVTFNGVDFNFQLEFGASTENGISYFDEFHVLENEGATTKLYGTLIEVGTVSFNR